MPYTHSKYSAYRWHYSSDKVLQRVAAKENHITACPGARLL